MWYKTNKWKYSELKKSGSPSWGLSMVAVLAVPAEWRRYQWRWGRPLLADTATSLKHSNLCTIPIQSERIIESHEIIIQAEAIKTHIKGDCWTTCAVISEVYSIDLGIYTPSRHTRFSLYTQLEASIFQFFFYFSHHSHFAVMSTRIDIKCDSRLYPSSPQDDF